MTKFRTMRQEFCRGERYGGASADAAFEQLLCDPARRRQFEQSYKLHDDPRVTRVGCVPRRTPRSTSCRNCLTSSVGDLSLVGPRAGDRAGARALRAPGERPLERQARHHRLLADQRGGPRSTTPNGFDWRWRTCTGGPVKLDLAIIAKTPRAVVRKLRCLLASPAGSSLVRMPGVAEPLAAVDIVCLADMEWDYAVWTNRQHVMSRLPQLASNVRVLYVAPPRFVASVAGAPEDSSDWITGFGDPERGSDVGCGRSVSGCGSRNPEFPSRIRRRRATHAAFTASGSDGVFSRPLAGSGWSGPYSGATPRLAGSLRGPPAASARVRRRRRLHGSRALPPASRRRRGVPRRGSDGDGDLVFVTSARLGRQRRLLNERCVEVGNAADIDLFATARGTLSRPPDLAAATGPIVCFHGTLGDQKLDARLLARIASRRPGWTFALLGHEPDGGARMELAGVANVRLLGLKPQQQVPAYPAAADAAIVPYRINDYTLGVDALKAYECLAAGVPVVATDLPCFAGLEPQVRTCRTDAEFDLALAETIAAPPPPLPLQRLETYTWSAKASRQFAEVQNLVAEVAS